MSSDEQDLEMEAGKRRHTAAGLLFSLLILAVIVIAVVAVARWQSRGVDYSIQFRDARGIAKGDKITLSGIAIGEVRDVKLVGDGDVLVRVRVEDDQADKIKQGSTALIASPSFPNVSGQKVVEIYNPPDENAKPIEEDSTVEGQENVVALKSWQIKQKLSKVGAGASGAARSMADKLSEMAEELKDIPESPEVKAALEKMSAMADALGQKSKDGLAALSKEWGEMTETMGPVLAQWRAKGGEKLSKTMDAAKELWETKGAGLRQALADRLSSSSSPAETPAPDEPSPPASPTP